MPIRIQRKRTKGWKAPEGAVYVGRPTKWGNPFTIEQCGSAQNAVDKFRVLQLRPPYADVTRRLIQAELGGKDLMCFCPLDQPCHADVLLEIANS